MKEYLTPRVVWSLVWAVAIIASAFVFRNNAAGAWIETALVGLAVTFVVLKPERHRGSGAS